MDSRAWLRLAPVAGLVWVALVIVSVILGSDQPSNDDPVLKFVTYFSDGGNRDQLAIATVLAAIGGPLFLWFLTGVRDLLRSEEGLWGNGAPLVFGAGIAFVILLWAGAATGYAYASAADFFDNFRVDAQSVHTAMVLSALSFWFVAFGSVAAAVMIGAASIVMLGTGVLPAWLGWVGLVLAALSFLGALFIPGLAALVWVLIVSVLLMLRQEPSAPPAAPAPTAR
jgi:hypothetical protein